MKPITDEYARIGAILRQARKSLGLRQADISGPLGKTDSNIGQVEKGQTRYGLDRLRAHAQLVSADVEVLVGSKMADGGEGIEYQLVQAARLMRRIDRGQLRTLLGLLSVWNSQLPAEKRVDLPSPSDLAVKARWIVNAVRG